MLRFHFNRQRLVLPVCYIQIKFLCCILFSKSLLSREEDGVLFLLLCVLKITTVYLSRINLAVQGGKAQNCRGLPPVLTACKARHSRHFCLKYLKIPSEIPSFVFCFSSQIWQGQQFRGLQVQKFFFKKEPTKNCRIEGVKEGNFSFLHSEVPIEVKETLQS